MSNMIGASHCNSRRLLRPPLLSTDISWLEYNRPKPMISPMYKANGITICANSGMRSNTMYRT